MAILNPCCCITLRTGTKIVSIIDIIIALIFLIIFITDLSWNISENGKATDQLISNSTSDITHTTPTTISNNDTGEEDISCEDEEVIVPSLSSVTHTSYVTSGVWTILIVFLATNVGISALLYTGARNYSIKRSKWWFYIQTVITSVALVALILIICFQVSFTLVVLDLLHLIYRFYTLWVVYLFIGELTYLDTLCHLNSTKKGTAGGIMYPAPIYTTDSSPYNHFPYSTNHYQQPHHLQYTDTGTGANIPGNSPFPYNSSDDGLPHNGGTGGGIDNPTYLP